MTTRACLLALMLGLLLTVATGCGDDEADPAGGPDSDWTDPSADGVLSESEVLAALAAHLDEGGAFDAETFTQDAQRVAEVLWPQAEDGQVSAAARTHLGIALIVGDAVRRIATSETGRAELLESDPIDVEIHDAFAATIAKGPQHYRVWCGNEGQALLVKLENDRRARFFGGDDK